MERTMLLAIVAIVIVVAVAAAYFGGVLKFGPSGKAVNVTNAEEAAINALDTELGNISDNTSELEESLFSQLGAGGG
jgi:hypothetical protein